MGGVRQKDTLMIKLQIRTAVNDTAGAHQATVAISGIVALLARSQARRLAEAAVPANDATAPAVRKVES